MRDGGDDLDLSEVLEQLFSTLGLDDPAQRADLVDQVRDGLRGALNPHDDGTEDAPRVVVLDGGRGADEPRDERAREPHFTVLDGDERRPRGRLTQLSVEVGRPPRAKRASLAAEGVINVYGDSEQTLLFGKAERHLRVQARIGAFALIVDGAHAGQLASGQTCDVIGRVVIARAVAGDHGDDNSARGRYVVIG